MDDCVGLAHLIKALFVPGDWQMAMFTLYCDASGKEQDQLLVVAGYIAPADKWKSFGSEWIRILRSFDVNYFHMREFAHSVGEYKGWKGDEGRRRGLLNALTSLIASHAEYWVGAAILRKVYVTVDADYQLHEFAYQYPLCGLICVGNADGWRNANHHADDSMEYIFESGDAHRGQLMDIVERQTGTTPLFRNRLNAVPLQAADFAAYEVRHALNNILVETDELFEKFRASFGLLAKIPSIWGPIDEPRLRVFCRMQDIPRRVV